MKRTIAMCTLALAIPLTLVGCGDDESYYEKHDYTSRTSAADRVKDAIDGAGDAGKDLIDGAENAADDLIDGVTGN